MDAELDTGPILAQTTVPIEDDDCTIEQIGPKLIRAELELLPQVFERLAAGDPGDPQTEEGATWAGYFGEDYASVDWAQPARKIHDQVRAWHLTFGLSEVQRADRGAGRRARQAPAHEPHRPGQRRAGRPVRRRDALDRRVRARCVVSALQVAKQAKRCNKCLPLRLNRRS